MSRPAFVLGPLIVLLLAVGITVAVTRGTDDIIAEPGPTEPTMQATDPFMDPTPEPDDTESPFPDEPFPAETEPPVSGAGDPAAPATPAPAEPGPADPGTEVALGPEEGTLPLTGQTAVGAGVLLLLGGGALFAILRRRS